MTIDEMKYIRQKKGYTYGQIAEFSGVPLETVQEIFSGKVKNPGYDILRALEEVFQDRFLVAEGMAYEAEKIKGVGDFTIADYYRLPDDKHAELIDGEILVMEAPSYLHQKIAGEIYRQIANFVVDHGEECEPLISPIDVQLDCDDKTMVQPDVVILCKKDKIRRWGIFGCPDFVLEVVSESSRKKDCFRKLYKYSNAGVREYWILDPYERRLLVYFFESGVYPVIYGLEDCVPVNIYEGKLMIQFATIHNWLSEYACGEAE